MSNFILDTDKKVKEKLDMLQSISDIQIATKLLEESKQSENVFDDHYKKLKCELTTLDRSSSEFQLIQDYAEKTHAATHSSYKLELLDVFKLLRGEENENYCEFSKSINNKMLLWHGSRLTNYVGILSQGLRIAPPEAPSTGYMFGKGVYFADMVSKSANYCYTNPNSNIGCMILCEVALGDMNEKYFADYNANLLPAGKMSTKGCGKTAPNAAEWKKLDDVTVPVGSPVATNIPQGSLMYNEYIVYNVKQIRMKYLLKVKFDYKYKY